MRKRGPSINPSKVYLDPRGCKRGHDPCLRRLSDDKCVDCGRLSGKDVAPEDRYCQKCGCLLEIGKSYKTLQGLCEECVKFDKRWYRDTVFLCVDGVKPFRGGHFRREEIDASLKLATWAPGMIFEEWKDKRYVKAWCVMMDGGLQWLEEIKWKAKGDKRILVP